jgi:hypothetical protein
MGVPMVVLVNALMALPFAMRLLEPPLALSQERYGRLADSLGIEGLGRLRLVDWPLLRGPLFGALATSAALSMGDLGVIAFFGGAELTTLPLLLYQRLAMRSEPHINALVNLAVLHEDRGEMHQAERCLRKVLEAKPNHARARLFMKDVSASKEALYDEGDQRDEAKRKAELDTPVTDFELSVRSRNCLKKMNIRTLRDLLMITKAELLSYKNFGETSLTEIEAMLETMRQDRLTAPPEERLGADRPVP